MYNYKKYTRSVKGFTLVEAIISIVIVAAIASASVLLFMQLDSWFTMRIRRSSQMEMKYALNRFVKEVREMKSNTTMTLWSSTQLQYSDIDDQGVSFAFSSGTLTLNSVTLLENLNDVTFTYLTSSGATASAISEIAIIRCTIDKADPSMAMQTSAWIRNSL